MSRDCTEGAGEGCVVAVGDGRDGRFSVGAHISGVSSMELTFEVCAPPERRTTAALSALCFFMIPTGRQL